MGLFGFRRRAEVPARSNCDADGNATAAVARVRRHSFCSSPSSSARPARRPTAHGRLLPSLFIIGSIKTGSSSLWSQLVDGAKSHLTHGALTDKGDISAKEKDFFGDPSMWRRGRGWYERIWPQCPAEGQGVLVGIDATPAYHVWHDAPKNMATFFGAGHSGTAQLRLVWMLREPVSKFWSYFWELKSYGGEWDKVDFAGWAAPKLARARECLRADPSSPLWPPSLPPPYQSCAPHLDHGLYHPQLVRWLQFFRARQLLLVSFKGYARAPSEVVRGVLLHGGLPRSVAADAAARTVQLGASKLRRPRSRGAMPHGLWEETRALYAPFVERLYALIREQAIAVSPCNEQGTRFLETPPRRNGTSASSNATASTDAGAGESGGDGSTRRAKGAGGKGGGRRWRWLRHHGHGPGPRRAARKEPEVPNPFTV